VLTPVGRRYADGDAVLAEACGTLGVIAAHIPGGDEEHDTMIRLTYYALRNRLVR
jgi:hypothetical protein